MSSAHQLIHSSESVEWYTPARYIEAARAVLDRIDLDPASCLEANHVVGATVYYNQLDDGLSQPWYGRVWLNPPYGRVNGKSNQYLWSQKLLSEYDACRVTAALLLVNAQTSDRWFQPLWEYPLCFTDHRIKFWTADGTSNQPTHSNVFVYFGNRALDFEDVFRQFGHVVLP